MTQRQKQEQEHGATLPPNGKGVEEMPKIMCEECNQHNQLRQMNSYWADAFTIQVTRDDESYGPQSHGQTVAGTLTCTQGHQTPFKLVNNISVPTVQQLTESHELREQVPEGIVEDVQEGERCYFNQSLKASAVMFRRSIQLALEDLGAPTKLPLGPLLDFAQEQNPKWLSEDTDFLAKGVKRFGDAGAHHKGDLIAQQVAMLSHVAVLVLNELYDPERPAMQSQKGSSG